MTINKTKTKEMQEILLSLTVNRDLNPFQARSLASMLFSAETPDQFIRSSIILLRKKGESPQEITAFASYLRHQALKLDVDLPYLTDFCGTGGDQKNTFNISTLSALIAAGAGANVVKHGNRSVSSHCGSSDLMERLGVRLKITPKNAVRILKKTGFVYLHAPYFHPAFKRVQPIRQELKVKTIFNFLGPLLNPAHVKHQLIGVSDPSLMDVLAEALIQLKSSHVWTVMNEDGYDEISLTGNAQAIQILNGRIKKLILKPADFGLNKINKAALQTSSVSENVHIAKNILIGKDTGPRRDVVLANSALGLLASGRAYNLREGVALARFSLETGRAMHVLNNLVKESKKS